VGLKSSDLTGKGRGPPEHEGHSTPVCPRLTPTCWLLLPPRRRAATPHCRDGPCRSMSLSLPIVASCRRCRVVTYSH
jgi:hypothetical protein